MNADRQKKDIILGHNDIDTGSTAERELSEKRV